MFQAPRWQCEAKGKPISVVVWSRTFPVADMGVSRRTIDYYEEAFTYRLWFGVDIFLFSLYAYRTGGGGCYKGALKCRLWV